MAILKMENWDEFPTLAETAFKSYAQQARGVVGINGGQQGLGWWANGSADRIKLTPLTQGKNGIGKALSVAMVRENIQWENDGGTQTRIGHNSGGLYVPTGSVQADGTTRIYCGWFRLSNLALRFHILQLENSAGGNSRMCLSLAVNVDGHIYVSQGDTVIYSNMVAEGGDVQHNYLSRATNALEVIALGNSTSLPQPPVRANTWHFMELRYRAGTGGAVELRIDNQVCFNASYTTRIGINQLRLSALPYTNSPNDAVVVGNLASTSTLGAVTTVLWDGLFILDTTGSHANTFVGPSTLYSLFPSGVAANGEGGQNTFDTVGAANQQTAVATLDSDTSYIQAEAPGNITFDYANLPVTGDIVAVELSAIARKTGVDGKTLQFKTGATEASAGAPIALGGTYAAVSQLLHTNPETSAAWTKSQVDTLQVKLETASI
jgi:hypothetical protein